MNLLKRQQPPSHEQIEASAHSVIETVEKTGLDRKKLLIMGGGALALAGLRLAGDVDLIIPEYDFDEIRRDPPYSTPSGIPLRFKARSIYPVLETYRKTHRRDAMHVDITTSKRDYGNDTTFEDELGGYETFEGYRFLPPALVLARKMRNADYNRKKDRDDIILIQRHLEEIERRTK